MSIDDFNHGFAPYFAFGYAGQAEGDLNWEHIVPKSLRIKPECETCETIPLTTTLLRRNRLRRVNIRGPSVCEF
jgi:hypothetical protein